MERLINIGRIHSTMKRNENANDHETIKKEQILNKHTKTNKTQSLREKAELSTFKVNKLHSERKSISKEPINVFHSRKY